MRPLLLNSTFHVLFAFACWLLVQRLLARKGESMPIGGQLRHLLRNNLILAILLGGTVLNLSLRFVAGYINPRDFLQDVIAAKQYVAGQTLYPVNLGQLATAENLKSFVGQRELERVPILRAEFAMLSENVDQNAHLPLNAMVFALPVMLLGTRASFVAMWLVSSFLLVIVVRLLRQGFGFSWDKRDWFAILVVLFGWYPVISTLRSGQSGCLIALLCIGGWAALRKGRQAIAGTLVGAAACLNLFPVFLLGYFLFRARTALLTGMLTIGVITATAAFTAPPGTFSEWAITVAKVSQAYIPIRGNQSLAALVAFPLKEMGLAVNYQALTAGLAAVVAVFLVLTMKLWKPRQPTAAAIDAEYPIFLVAMLMTSPLCWERYFPVLILPFAVLLLAANTRSFPFVAASIAVLLLFAIPTPVIAFAYEAMVPVLGTPWSLVLTTMLLLPLPLLFSLLLRVAQEQRRDDAISTS